MASGSRRPDGKLASVNSAARPAASVPRRLRRKEGVIAIAVESPASFAQSATYSAEALRHVFGTLLQRGSGIGSIVGGLVGSGDMLVTAGTGMQVLVA